jgi:hypothetical protein
VTQKTPAAAPASMRMAMPRTSRRTSRPIVCMAVAGIATPGCERHNPAMKTDHLRLCPDWRLWVLSGIFALIDAAWLPFSRLTIAWSSFLVSGVIVAICVAWYCAGYLVRLSDGSRLFAAGFAFIWLAGNSTAVFGHLMMTLPMPMADSMLADWDRALGLDWIGYLSWVTARPWLSQALLWVYYAIIPASLLAFVILHFSGRRERTSEYLALSFVGAVIAITMGAAFPTLGTVTYFHAPQALMAAFPEHTGAQWVQQLAELRSGLPVELNHMIGLVSFPSYHVALTMIVAWCFRGFRFVFPICAIYALATASSAPIIGGHYFVDLVAGAALACILIAASRIRWSLAIAPVAAK